MQIILNGADIAVPEATTIAQLVEQQGLANKRIAIEINETIVPRSTHATTVLRSGDRVEIVHAIGGG